MVGRGGHIYPAIALAERLRAEGDRAVFIGLRGGLEERLVPAAGFDLLPISAAPLRRAISPAIVTTVARNLAGLREASRHIAALRPDAVIATGGYVAFPVMFAAWLAQRRRSVHEHAVLGLLEPNAIAGLTNRLLAPFVDELWGSVPAVAGRFVRRFVQTGVPVRQEFRNPPNRREAAQILNLDPTRPTILVMGGSQGARSINAALSELWQGALPLDWQIVHVTGPGYQEAATHAAASAIAQGRVHIYEYLDNPIAAYAAADLVVARAGASTLAELAALGKPALLVPYPFATADHQRHNAEAFVGFGAGRLLDDAELHGASLRAQLEAMMEPATLHALTSAAQKLALYDAAGAILDRIRTLVAQRGTTI